MKDLILKSLLCSVIIATGTLSLAQDVAVEEPAAEEVEESSVSVGMLDLISSMEEFETTNPEEILQLSKVVQEKLQEFIENDPTLLVNMDRAEIDTIGGFTFRKPMLNTYGFSMHNRLETGVGIALGLTLGSVFHACDNDNTWTDDAIRAFGAAEAVNYLAQGTGWDMVKMGHKFNTVAAGAELILGVYLLNMWRKDRKGAGEGSGNNSGSASNRGCSLFVGSAGVAMGGKRLHESGSFAAAAAKNGFVSFFNYSVRTARGL